MAAVQAGAGLWTGAVEDHVIVCDRVLLDVGFRAARARLGILAGGGMLSQASEVAYGDGVAGLAEPAGMSRLAGVSAEGLADTQDCARIALRWEAIAADGKMFAALDADLLLTQAGERITVLALAGAYRRQPGRAGAGLDGVLVRRLAGETVRNFLARLACALVHPAGTAGSAVTPRGA